MEELRDWVSLLPSDVQFYNAYRERAAGTSDRRVPHSFQFVPREGGHDEHVILFSSSGACLAWLVESVLSLSSAWRWS